MRLRFTPRAIRQFTSISEYISLDNPTAARKVGRQIRKACELLRDFPSIGRPGMRSGTQELSVSGLPYVIVHRVTQEEILILGIYHVRQIRPGQDKPSDL